MGSYSERGGMEKYRDKPRGFLEFGKTEFPFSKLETGLLGRPSVWVQLGVLPADPANRIRDESPEPLLRRVGIKSRVPDDPDPGLFGEWGKSFRERNGVEAVELLEKLLKHQAAGHHPGVGSLEK